MPNTSPRRCRPSLGARALLALLTACAALSFSGRPTLAQCGSNAIVCENNHLGAPSSEWDVAGAGDASIQGFATEMSIDRGATVHFKIKTDAPSYQIVVYRMGYYGGMGARQMASINPSAALPQSQPACLSDSTTGLIDCGNWEESASWTVPTDATSGIYFAKLTRIDTGGASHIVFVVRDDASGSDLLFQTSDTTWQAYNQYGGNSLYVGGPGTNPGRAYAVSYNRPITTRGTSPDNSVFNAEYPMVRWLEANGYDVSYFASADTDRSGAKLLDHKVFASVGHDMYWSGPQRANVEAARAAGVNLAFFGGGNVFWKTRWANSIDTANAPHRTLVSYKETLANAVIDPQDPPTWTGSWRDTRFSPPADGGLPENALTGTIFGVDCCSPTNPNIAVSASAAAKRFWRNTPIAASGGGVLAPLVSGPAAASGGILGNSWDEDLDNGWRPAGLMQLSWTPATVARKLQNWGAAFAPGSAIHSITLYRHTSGALVFSAGAAQWSWGLDNTHDRLPDATTDYTNLSVRQATVNLLADMDAQPLTLQPGLTPATKSTDVTAPSSTITSPVNGSMVLYNTGVMISGTASDPDGPVSVVEVSTDGGVTWKRATGGENWTFWLSVVTTGAISLKSRATDDNGNIETPGAGISVTGFSVTCPCTLWDPALTVPAVIADNDGSAVELGVKFRSDANGFLYGLRFYKSASNTGTHVGRVYSSTGTLLATATFTNETASGWQQVIFANPIAVTANTTYVASYHTNTGHYSATEGYFASSGVDRPPLHAPSNVTTLNGVYAYGSGGFPTFSYNATNYWVDVIFGTAMGEGGAPVPPVVTAVSPAPGTTNVSAAANVAVTFSEAVTPASISTSTIELRDAANALVAGVVSYDAATRTATLDPTGLLAGASTYTIVVRGGTSGPRVTDTSGLPLASNLTSAFTTGASVACPCSLWDSATTVPGLIDSADPNAVELGVKFRTDTAGFISGVRYYKSAANTGTHVANLWTTNGTLLATATFAGESSSGWQEATFGAPVPVAANTLYVASYHTNSGHYSVNDGYFASAGVDAPPLRAPANGVSVNGVYRYGASGFPDQTYSSANYWVDVVFTTTAAADTTPPTVVSTTPADATTVGATTAVTATFSEAIAPTTISTSTFELLNADGGIVAATVSYNAPTRTATLTAASGLATNAVYTVRLHGGTTDPRIEDSAGNALANDVTWSFTTTAPACPCTIWPSTVVPAVVDSGDASSVELGVKFRTDTYGFITGVRYYKSPANSGTHVGKLWTSTGTLLASATFTSESNSGWQQVLFATPVEVFPNTTYVASYHTNTGHYAASGGYFASTGVDRSPLHALANSSSVNGVYRYGASGFPSSSWNASNYWVDVVFTPGTADTISPVVSMTAPADGAAVSGAITVSASATDNIAVAGVQFQLDGVNLGAEVIASPYSISWGTWSTPNGTHLLRAVARDAAGNMTTAAPVTVNVVNVDTVPPTVTGQTPAPGATDISATTTVTATFGEPIDPATVTTSSVELRDVSNALVAATVTYDTASRTATLTPGAPLVTGATYTARVHGGTTDPRIKDLSGNALAADAVWSFTIRPMTIIDTTAADFAKGTLGSGGYIGLTADGELMLSPLVGIEFSGTTLPAGWASSPWSGTSSTGVSGGVLSVDGASVSGNSLYHNPVTTLDFSATFSGAAWQHAGFAVYLTDGVWAMFSSGPGDGLYARSSNNSGSPLNTLIAGNWFGAAHRFRIVWNDMAIYYFIDGVQVAWHSLTISGTMRAMASDYSHDGSALNVDFMRMTPYAAASTYVSGVFDAAATVTWTTAAWTGVTPTGTAVALSVRYGNTAVPDASWTAFTPVSGPINGAGRYLQYRLQLSTSDPSQTPVVNAVTLTSSP